MALGMALIGAVKETWELDLHNAISWMWKVTETEESGFIPRWVDGGGIHMVGKNQGSHGGNWMPFGAMWQLINSVLNGRGESLGETDIYEEKRKSL